MTIAYIKNADGSGGVVQNTFRDSAGVLHILLSNYYTDDVGVQHQVFFDTILTTTPSGIGQNFIATDRRQFVATDNRNFEA